MAGKLRISRIALIAMLALIVSTPLILWATSGYFTGMAAWPNQENAYSCKGCNVVLISIDTLRADHLGAYGYYRNTSPNIDRFAEESVLFENAFSQSTWTLPAHASMLSGAYPSRTGFFDFLNAPLEKRQTIEGWIELHPVSGELTMLAEVFKEMNYTTLAVTDDGFVSGIYGFSQGFDEYVEYYTNGSVSWDGSLTEGNYPVIMESVERLRDGQPFFLFLHTFNVHVPYIPKAPYDRYYSPEGNPGNFSAAAERLFKIRLADPSDVSEEEREYIVSQYDGEIRYTDEQVGRFLMLLQELNLSGNTIVIITADHGESFFENFWGENYFDNREIRVAHSRPYEAVVRVPLIARFPGGPKNARVKYAAQLIDIVPTLVKVTGAQGIRLNQSMEGGSLLELNRERNIITEHGINSSRTGVNGTWIIVRWGDYKFVRNWRGNRQFLFNTAEDPGEAVSVLGAPENRQIAYQLRSAAASHMKSHGFEIDSSGTSGSAEGDAAKRSAVEETLKSLGYVN